MTACLEDQRLENYTETGRAPYLIQIVKRAGLTPLLLERLLEPFDDDIYDGDRRQRIYLLGELARRNEHQVWELLTKLSSDNVSEAWDALADLGPVGVEWLADHILDGMPIEDKWRAKYWKEETDRLGEAAVRALNKAIEECDDYYKDNKYEPSKRSQTLDEAIEEIKNARFVRGSIGFIANKLTDEEVLRVTSLWLEETEQRKARSYSQVFRYRDFPLPVSVLIDRVRSGDYPSDFEEVLSYIDDPLARDLGLELLTRSEPDYRGYACLVSSFLDSDIPFLVESMNKFVRIDPHELHSLCYPLEDIAKDISVESRFVVNQWMYENNPCSFCRAKHVQSMIADGNLPDSYRQEIPYDASSDVRELAAQQPSN
jgi:hypothetical protein